MRAGFYRSVDGRPQDLIRVASIEVVDDVYQIPADELPDEPSLLIVVGNDGHPMLVRPLPTPLAEYGAPLQFGRVSPMVPQTLRVEG